MSQEQRRLAAIVFTDIVGYSAFSERNEALAMRLLDNHNSLVRRVMERHGGREVKTIGDSFLLEFPSALEAVRFVVSAYGARSDWYRNVTSSPPVMVQLGGRRFVPDFRVVPADEERARLAAYYSDHPTDAKFLAKRFLGAEDTEEGFVRAAGALPMVAFRPKGAPGAGP